MNSRSLYSLAMRQYIACLALAGCLRADTLLIRSADGGRTWTDIDPGPPHAWLWRFRQGAASYYATTDADVLESPASSSQWSQWKSVDGGHFWYALDVPGARQPPFALVFDPGNLRVAPYFWPEQAGSCSQAEFDRHVSPVEPICF